MLNIDLTNPIAAGRTAEIFAWDEKYVLKLYFSHFPDDEAENEAALINAVTAAGVLTPAVVETTMINGRCGFIMERIAGDSLLTLLQADLGKAGEYAQLLAELHANLHQYQSENLPGAHEWLARKINRAQPLTDVEKTAVLNQLVQEETLSPITVADMGDDYFLHAKDLPLLRQIQAGDWQPHTTLLSPFDNLICDRDRTEALWDFYFRIEIYVPKAKREYGYYVLPILYGDRLIGRIDPKMDRKTNTLQIDNVYAEPNAPKYKKTVQEIGRAVQSLAKFLGATQIAWGNVPEMWAALKQVG